MKYLGTFGVLAAFSQIASASCLPGGPITCVSEPSMLPVYGAGLVAVVAAKMLTKKKA